MSENNNQTQKLEKLKFHWDVWKGEAKGFWRRAALCSVVLLIIILHEYNAIKWNSGPVSTVSDNALPENVSKMLNRWLFCPLGWCTLAYFLHGFVDLMRHRVPNAEEGESIIHNNFIDVGRIKNIDLRPLGHGLYYAVFLFYFAIFTFWMAMVTYHAFEPVSNAGTKGVRQTSVLQSTHPKMA